MYLSVCACLCVYYGERLGCLGWSSGSSSCGSSCGVGRIGVIGSIVGSIGDIGSTGRIGGDIGRIGTGVIGSPEGCLVDPYVDGGDGSFVVGVPPMDATEGDTDASKGQSYGLSLGQAGRDFTETEGQTTLGDHGETVGVGGGMKVNAPSFVEHEVIIAVGEDGPRIGSESDEDVRSI